MQDFFKDVTPDPSTGNEDIDNEQELEQGEERTAESGAEAGEGEGEKSGRTIENVYRELSRKQEEFQSQMMSQFMDAQRQLVEALKVKPEPEKKTGTLDDMSVSELESLRGQVAENSPDKLGEFDAYLNKRRVDDQVASRMSDWEKRQSVEQARGKAQQDALRRYPELADRSSAFYAAVNNRLNELGDSYVNSNPRAVLDAANDVAAEMGVSPRAAGKAASMRGRVATRGNSNPKAKEAQADDESGPSQAEIDKIAAKLQGALPKGKKFNTKDLKDKSKFYRNNLQYYLRG